MSKRKPIFVKNIINTEHMGLCTISVPEDFRCPFDIDEFSFLQWFNKQTFKDIDAATDIFFILKTLNQHQISVKTRFLILHKFNEILPALSDVLVNQYIDKPFPLQDNLASTVISKSY